MHVSLLEVSERLEVPPVATFAAVCLWNFKPLFVDEGIDNLENLATLNTPIAAKVAKAAKDSPKEWRTYFWIAVGGEVVLYKLELSYYTTLI